MTNPFYQTGGLKPHKSLFDLSYEKKMTADMGLLYPILCDEMVPGDIFKFGNQSVIRFQPLVAPVLHEVQVVCHYYFVPYRILWEQWEEFISGWSKEDSTQEFLDPIPVWIPQSPAEMSKGTLWDYLGFPTYQGGMQGPGPGSFNQDFAPIDMPRRAYNMIWNEYYRDQNLQPKVALDNWSLLRTAWEKDYFTSALPFQQKGISPSFPISGSTSAVFSSDIGYSNVNLAANSRIMLNNSDTPNTFNLLSINPSGNVEAQKFKTYLDKNNISFDDATTFDINDLRLAVQLQKWQERSARGGVRYTELLRSHHGVSPRDDRLQRPEYCGGSKHNVIFSEVLQTSETASSPQGNMAGHGLSVNSGYCGKYYATEYGLLMGIMKVVPRPAYQQGINRQWLRRTKEDFFWPEFVNLSEQAVERGELYVSGSPITNRDIFGYQGRYDEMRYKPNQVCADMRDIFNYWHLGRVFTDPPNLNSTFIECNPRKDIFAVQDEPGLIISFANLIRAYRPIPRIGEPGLLDHH
ncbi:major capsid protein [Tortoise microvirus 26]|nr:major capsid protein [Tortoise microvirus 26]